MNDKNIVYDIQNLIKYYPEQENPANNNVNLQIFPGEVFGILGDNGSGKTTLVRQMVNLLKISSGSITLWGRPIAQDPLYVSLNVGYMPQEAFVLDTLKVGEMLYYTARLRGLGRREAQHERDRLIELWDIKTLREQRISELSGGQRRLSQLAMALIGSRPVLVLDEPTNDLAPQRRRQVWDVLRDMNNRLGTTVIFITHDATEAEKVVKRVGIMQSGKLVAIGRPSQLKQHLDQKLRLELYFSPHEPPTFSGVEIEQIEPGRWIIPLQRSEVSNLLKQVDVQSSLIDDFRLTSATLEDLYIHYVNEENNA